MQSEHNLLIADETGLYKTSFEESLQVEWKNTEVVKSTSVAVNNDGLIFVANSTTDLTVISSNGKIMPTLNRGVNSKNNSSL